jgi:L-lactate utilization protein LutC
VRRSLGREAGVVPQVVADTGLSVPGEQAIAEAAFVHSIIAEQADSLFEAASTAAEAADWTVHRMHSFESAALRVLRLCREREVTATVLTGHDALEEAQIAKTLTGVGIEAAVPDGGPTQTKAAAFRADAGITGADYFIAETGTLVLHPRQHVSRLVSLAPPVHIALLKKGQVLPSLDELFILERAEHLIGKLAGSMNLISGPSRTGDIEGTIVKGIHGPVETHLVMIG